MSRGLGGPWTALTMASARGMAKTVESLLEYGADHTLKDKVSPLLSCYIALLDSRQFCVRVTY